MAEHEYMQPPTRAPAPNAPPLPFEIPRSRRGRKRGRDRDEDEPEDEQFQDAVGAWFRRNRFNLTNSPRGAQEPPRGGAAFMDQLGEIAVGDPEEYLELSGEESSFDDEALYGPGRLADDRSEADESEDGGSAGEAAEAPGDAPAAGPAQGSWNVPVESQALKEPLEKLAKALARQGFESIKAAKKNCPLCKNKYDLHLGSRCASLDVGHGPGDKGGHHQAFEGLNKVYVHNIDEPEEKLFALMEDFWEESVVRVVEGYEQEPVRLSAAQIQLHYQYCLEDHPVESFRPYIRMTKEVLKNFADGGLFIQEVRLGQVVGKPRVHIPVLKEFRSVLKDLIALRATHHDQKNLYRQQFGLEPFCAHVSKRRRTAASERR